MKSLDELINEISDLWNGDDGPGIKHVKTLCSALQTAMDNFKTEMINRGAEFSYYEAEDKIIKILERYDA